MSMLFRISEQPRDLAHFRRFCLPAELLLQTSAQGIRGGRFPMGNEHSLGRDSARFEPRDELRVVGMRRKALELANAGADPHVLPVHLQLLDAVHQRPPSSTNRLVTDE